MQATLRLFKAVPIVSNLKSVNEEILSKTLRNGWMFSAEVYSNYSTLELESLIVEINNTFGFNAKRLNQSFHKSWYKVATSSIEELIIEQLIHYITTYGFESLGIYDENSIYIPAEKLDLPKINIDKFEFVVIKGYTYDELIDKCLNIINSGIALKQETLEYLLDVFSFIGYNFTPEEIDSIKNKEVKNYLYDKLKIVPKNNLEFLRYLVFKATGQTLLIKNVDTISLIKSRDNNDLIDKFEYYNITFGYDKLAEIFYRFKPIFLAFRNNHQLKIIINRIRKLAAKYHKPMPVDYLNSITEKISNGKNINLTELGNKLNNANIFRKIRLAYALHYRSFAPESILYKIRNGKGYATDHYFIDPLNITDIVLNEVNQSIINDISLKVKHKKIFIPGNINYVLPVSEKQFTGFFPSGTCVSLAYDMVIGVYWENVEDDRVDLDLSLLSLNSKFGWNAHFRDEDGNILFSGDMTDATNGASEMFYIKNKVPSKYLLVLNYYNMYSSEIKCPFRIFVARQYIDKLKVNHTINPNNIVAMTNSVIKSKQLILGLIDISQDRSNFYFNEIMMANRNVSRNTAYMEHSRQYLYDFYTNMIDLKSLLAAAGALMVDNNLECDIDLSYSKLEKDTFLNLMT